LDVDLAYNTTLQALHPLHRQLD